MWTILRSAITSAITPSLDFFTVRAWVLWWNFFRDGNRHARLRVIGWLFCRFRWSTFGIVPDFWSKLERYLELDPASTFFIIPKKGEAGLTATGSAIHDALPATTCLNCKGVLAKFSRDVEKLPLTGSMHGVT